MNRSRRFWLFSPLAVSTLFFVLCGWRNWRLTNDEDEVRLAIADHFLPTTDAGKIHKRSGTPIAQQPFQTDWILCQNQASFPGIKIVSLPNRSMQRLRQAYPQLHLKDFSSDYPQSPLLALGHAQFHDKSVATCQVYYFGNWESQTDTLILTRSRLPFSDERWHVTGQEPYKGVFVPYY